MSRSLQRNRSALCQTLGKSCSWIYARRLELAIAAAATITLNGGRDDALEAVVTALLVSQRAMKHAIVLDVLVVPILGWFAHVLGQVADCALPLLEQKAVKRALVRVAEDGLKAVAEALSTGQKVGQPGWTGLQTERAGKWAQAQAQEDAGRTIESGKRTCRPRRSPFCQAPRSRSGGGCCQSWGTRQTSGPAQRRVCAVRQGFIWTGRSAYMSESSMVRECWAEPGRKRKTTTCGRCSRPHHLHEKACSYLGLPTILLSASLRPLIGAAGL